MIEAGVVLLVAGVVLAILGISFAVDVSKGVGPGGELATVDSGDPSRTYTFFRIENKGIAIAITVITFLLAAGGLITGIVLLATHHH